MSDDLDLGSPIRMIDVEGLLIENWAREELDGIETLLYFQSIDPEGNGFRFCALTWAANDGEDRYQVLADGYGYFDGLRHIWWCPKSDGYKYYPDVETMILVLRRVADLEKRFCRDSE